MKSSDFQLDEYYLELLNEGNLGFSSDKNQRNKVNYLSNEDIAQRPYPGIRPFKTTEAPIFFGRDGQAGNLVKKLNNYNFLAVIGSSGSGKSSLVRAGLIPHLFAGYHERGGADWEIAICRPGDNPISNLAAALAGVKAGSSEHDKIASDYSDILKRLTDNPYALLEVAREINGGDGNILIIIDQFEELFRFHRESGKMDAQHFVNLLMNVTGESDSGVYIAVTMRSEYLGDCVQFRDLAESINKGQYLVPRLGRKELKRAIEGPVRMAGAEIHPSLVNKLVSEVGDDMDQLPILQHALMRTYEVWKSEESTESIGIKHYQNAGEMRSALGLHGDEIMLAFTAEQRQITKCIFQRVTDRSSDDRGIRRPCHLNEIEEVALYLNDKYLLGESLVPENTNGAKQIVCTSVQVNEVIEVLRHSNNAFLMPPDAVNLENNPIIDISHESIMRNWTQVGVWIQEELEEATIYKRLDEARRDKISDDKDKDVDHGYLAGSTLRDLAASREYNSKNAAWAARYHFSSFDSFEKTQMGLFEDNLNGNYSIYPADKDRVTYDLNIAYLADCILKEEERVVAIQKMAGQKYWKIVAVLTSVLAGIVAIALVWSYFTFSRNLDEANVVRENAIDNKKRAVKAENRIQEAQRESDSIEVVTNKLILELESAKSAQMDRIHEAERLVDLAESKEKKAETRIMMTEREVVRSRSIQDQVEQALKKAKKEIEELKLEIKKLEQRIK